MRKRVSLVVLSLFVILTTLTGCWNNVDISEIAISSAVGIDRTEDGKVVLSVQIIKPSATRSAGKAGGGGDKKSFVVASETADTVFAAIRGMLSKVNKKVFYSSAQVIVIGEKAAESGIKELLDFLQRDHETQYKTEVVVTRGTTAREILEQGYDLSDVPGSYIAASLKNTKARAFTKRTMLIELIKEITESGAEPTLGVIRKSGTTTATEGTAVFLKDRLVGWLDRYETRGYLFATNRVKSTILELENPAEPDRKVAIELLRTSSQIKLESSENGKPVFLVKIKAQGNIGEQQDGKEIKEEELIKVLVDVCNEKIKNEVLGVVKKCQTEYKSDIFGFGGTLHRENARLWREVEAHWDDEVFPEVDVKVTVDTRLLRSGLINDSIESR